MKLLIVGSDQVWSIERPYIRYLREFGWEVHLFPAHDIFSQYYSGGMLNKILYKAGLSPIYSRINKLFRKEVEWISPEVIWIFKGMEIFPETLQWAKEKKIKLVNYNPDNPFLFSGKGSGNSNITRAIPYYDLHFTYNLDVKHRLEFDLKSTAIFLPFGFTVSDETFHNAELVPEISGVCFLGNPDVMRAGFIMALAAKGIAVVVYGNGWQNFVDHPIIKVYPAVLGEELWYILRRYRVQLNLMRPHNENSHNMRTFEVPGIGGIMLAPDTTEHRLFFTEGEEIFLFKDVDECILQIRKLLSLVPAGADKIRNAARSRSLTSGYTYRDRAKFVMGTIEQLIRG